MRWPHEDAIMRRDEQLARTRRLSAWIVGGTAAASISLAAALGFALPGHTVTSGSGSSGSSGSRQAQQSGAGTSAGHASNSAGHHRELAPPQQAPVSSGGQPVVSSGGS